MKVLVAGSTGLVGSAIYKHFSNVGHEVVGISSGKVNLLDGQATIAFFKKERPQLVIDAAARVGGIGANNAHPVKFLSENVAIQGNLMMAAHSVGVEKFVFLGSSCIYPRDCPQPIREEYLMTGPLEATNSAYAVAKIAGIELVNSYRKEFGHNWISLMPTNLYGPNDNFNLVNSHVLPALIRRFIEARKERLSEVILWGSGEPRREFLHVNDLARAVDLATGKYDSTLHLNVGSGYDISIKELALKIGRETGFTGEIFWDRSKPDGTQQKLLDIARISALGWKPSISLDEGIRSTVKWYLEADAHGKVRK